MFFTETDFLLEGCALPADRSVMSSNIVDVCLMKTMMKVRGSKGTLGWDHFFIF